MLSLLGVIYNFDNAVHRKTQSIEPIYLIIQLSEMSLFSFYRRCNIILCMRFRSILILKTLAASFNIAQYTSHSPNIKTRTTLTEISPLECSSVHFGQFLKMVILKPCDFLAKNTVL